jgi:hypothetical protein
VLVTGHFEEYRSTGLRLGPDNNVSSIKILTLDNIIDLCIQIDLCRALDDVDICCPGSEEIYCYNWKNEKDNAVV